MLLKAQPRTKADLIREINQARAKQRRAVIPSTADEIGRDIDALLDAWTTTP